MAKILRSALVAVLIASGSLAAAAASGADVNNTNGTNVQDGRNTSSSSQTGKGKSGSAVGGQVSGVVTGGRASVDAHNTSKDSSVSSGDARGTNSASAFVGLNSGESGTVVASDITNSCTGSEACDNVQNGSNRYSLSQTLSAVTGDGIAGQVIGLVAAQRAEPSIVASNSSDGVDVSTGDATGTNNSSAFVGLNSSDGGPAVISDLSGLCNSEDCANLQDGSNRVSSRQSVDTASGDGVGGQVIGAITNNPTSIDAKNTTTDSSVSTGDATGDNAAAYFAGLNTSGAGPTVTASDVINSCSAGCDNVQNGDNRVSADQSARSTTGDGIAGQVIGAVSLSGSLRVVAANTTKDSDVTTGDGHATNDLAAFVGLDSTDGAPLITSDITGSCNAECLNLQDGTNRLTGSQSAHAATGDGIAGQILGLASVGGASLDATNTSEGDTVKTGDANAHNAASAFVGLNSSEFGPTVTAVDISGATATNLQDGVNNKVLAQAADASSGNGVAGQESEVVTAAGGSATVVLANTSKDVDASSGQSDFGNAESSFVGLNFSTATLIG